MKLTREQRKAFFRGESPRITHPGNQPCPVEKGEVYKLGSYCQIVVTGVRRDRNQDWSLVYEIRRRERPVWLAISAPRAATEAERQKFSGAQEHGYTHSFSQGLDGAEAVDRDEIANYRASIEARQRKQAEVVEGLGQFLGACQDLRAAVDEMDPILKQTVNRELWKMKVAIDGAERKLRHKMAA